MCNIVKGCLFTLILIIVCSGCAKNQRVLEKLGMDHTIGYDQLQGKLLVTATLPNPKSINEGNDEILTSTAKTSKEAKINIARESSRSIVTGQLRNTMYSEEIARSGLKDLIQNLARDPSISPRVKITLVAGSVHDLLTSSYPGHPETSQYVDHMLNKNLKNQNIPLVNLHQFTRDLLDDGIDPVAPIIKKAGDNVIIDGIALFKDDKYIVRLDPKYNLIFAMTRGNFKQGELFVELQEDQKTSSVMLGTLSSRHKFHVHQDNKGSWMVDLHLYLKGSIQEYTGTQILTNNIDIEQLAKQISHSIQASVNRMVSTMQTNGVDSIGIGKHIRNHMNYKEWNALKWSEVYPKVKLNCIVHTKIKEYGQIQQLPDTSK
ncbi:Ger(x)C family spore germination protein [Paenibacillus pini]|uniref:Spore germination protein GerQC n=1 Tax=Paenibacillus pini JCM 16418 TaxID=1236976 RepID=W7YT53_9BACL|nr:Ger(x)C family spore germination protein [Paenibacillus pini]GAF07811.1 spore germination protein GerQC [Paenibacillus pini JCM 16418]